MSPRVEATKRTGRAPDRLGEREARLAQGEIERCALERPPPVVVRRGHTGLVAVQRLGIKQRRELTQGARAGKRQRRREVGMVVGRVGDVLALPALPAAV
jgi:hypothetical protein